MREKDTKPGNGKERKSQAGKETNSGNGNERVQIWLSQGDLEILRRQSVPRGGNKKQVVDDGIELLDKLVHQVYGPKSDKSTLMEISREGKVKSMTPRGIIFPGWRNKEQKK
jgi:hypothetical protein